MDNKRIAELRKLVNPIPKEIRQGSVTYTNVSGCVVIGQRELSELLDAAESEGRLREVLEKIAAMESKAFLTPYDQLPATVSQPVIIYNIPIGGQLKSVSDIAKHGGEGMNEIKQDLAELVEEFTEYPRIYELGKRLVTAIDDVEQVAQENATLTQQFQKAQGEIEWLQAEAAAHLDALQKTLVYCRDIEEKVGNVYMGTLANQLDGYLEDSTTAGASFLARYKQYEAVVEAAKKRKVAKAHFDKLFEAAMQDNDMTPQQAGEVGLTELDVWQADDVLDAALAALDKGGE